MMNSERNNGSISEKCMVMSAIFGAQQVHLFYHTLDVIPRNWYIETQLQHGTGEWDILREGFL
ncbi:hypothetical protein NQ272_27955, partial [Escherichia coli]|nr:hypothetical protein [Escherichia coli]